MPSSIAKCASPTSRHMVTRARPLEGNGTGVSIVPPPCTPISTTLPSALPAPPAPVRLRARPHKGNAPVDDASLTNRPDLSAYWMPFTANRQFKADPRLFVAAKGLYYRTEDGREVLDATSGLWCVNAGHGRPEIAEAVQRQLTTLDYAPGFQMSHPG